MNTFLRKSLPIIELILCSLFFDCVALAQPASVPAPPGLVSWWPGEGNTTDLIGGNNGIVLNGAGYTNGEVGQAFDFTALTQCVDVGSPTNLQLQDFTIEGWIKRGSASVVSLDTANQGDGALFGYGHAGYGFGFRSNGTLYLTLSDISHVTSILTVSDTNFHHVAVTKVQNNVAFYIDGALAGTNSYNVTFSFTTHAGIGARTDFEVPFFGAIDELSVYNRALTTNEIQSIFAAGSAGKYLPPRNATAIAQVTNHFVVGVTITDGGYGYTNVPLVLIQGVNGSGATATAVVSNGVVVDIMITSAGIGYSNVPTIYIGNPPVIVTQPQTVTVNAHDMASFRVAAFGTTLNYQWTLNGTNITGATSCSLTVSNVVQTNLGDYAVVITNVFGTVTSSNATLAMYPFFTSSFQGLDTYWGYTNTLDVTAWGTGPLSYQWFDDGIALYNETNADLTLTNIQFSNAGLYSVVISNPVGSITNLPQQVVVNPAGVSLGTYPGLTITGVPGYNYAIQRTSDLADTNSWVTVANLTLTQPVQLWVDTNINESLPANPKQFYKVIPGQ